MVGPSSPAEAVRVALREEAAHDARNWVRLTYACNDRCIFCLDSDSHDGEMRDPEAIKRQILDGRRAGATRLILSGGEPTIHPRFLSFLKLGRLAGYGKVQTITNGRMFAYAGFLGQCLDAGLDEVTFSIHGPDARVHDALVGVQGAFEQTMAGLRNVLADGRPIVNVDVCVSRGNVRVLPDIIEMVVAMGVRELDLLQIVPFGRAFREGRDTLFYDLEEAAQHLRTAFAWSERPDMHLWLNRFPPPHCEGYEQLIQDPHKLIDEVRGRRPEFERQLVYGTPLDCREPARCRYCYLEHMCDTLEGVVRTARESSFDVLRVDTGAEARGEPVFGGDPASERRAKDNGDGKLRLPVAEPLLARSPEQRARSAGARTLRVVAPDLATALRACREHDWAKELELELESVEGLDAALSPSGVIDGKRLASVVVRDAAQAEQLLRLAADFEVVLWLTRRNETWILAQRPAPSRLMILWPTYERVTEAVDNDVDVGSFFGRLDPAVPVHGVPPCVLGRAPVPERRVLDAAMLEPTGRIEIFRFTARYIAEGFHTKSLRCRQCVHDATCRGMHINQVRAHGFSLMRPIAPV